MSKHLDSEAGNVQKAIYAARSAGELLSKAKLFPR